MGKITSRQPNKVIPTNRENSQFSKFRFPSDLGPNAFVIDFKNYSYDSTLQTVSQTSRTDTQIVLPLPQQIQDAYDVNVQSNQLGSLGAAALGVFQNPGSIDETAKNALQKAYNLGSSLGSVDSFSGLTNTLKDIGGQGAQYTSFVSRNILDSLGIEGLSLAGDLVNGTAVNPHTTLNFDGVNLKQFQFSWELAPRDESESQQLKSIIRKIKYHILPQYSSLPDLDSTGNRGLDRALLKYPDLAFIRFNGVDKSHYPRFKPGMISNFTIDYTPQGNVIVEGGKPAIVNISFTFQEAAIHTSGEVNTEESDRAPGEFRG